MRDDYLWDGSGEPDPDIEKLEGLLGRYRSERPAPELPETPVVPFRPRRAVFLPYAAVAVAAAVVLSLALGLWWRSSDTHPPVGPNTAVIKGEQRTVPPPPPGEPPPGVKGAKSPAGHPGPTPRPRPRTRPEPPVTPPVDVQAKYTPLVDVATADHLEQAELLLRSFRNASADDATEVAFDSRQSRELLDQNALLRRSAAAKKNLPVGQLLGDLEPFLLDIANLGPKPSRDDVREIQQRIERREMVSDLELYSSNRTTPGF